MPAITLRVGCALDASMSSVMKPWIASIRDARAQVAKEMQGIDGELAKGYRNAPAYARKGFDGATTAAQTSDKAITKSAEQAANAKIRAFNLVAGIHQRYLEQEARDEEKAAKASVARREKIARAMVSVASNSASNFGGVVRAGVGVAGGIARGMGVNFDMSSNVSAAVASQRASALLANKSYLEGASGMAGQRQDPAALEKEAATAGNATAHSTIAMTEAMTAFVEKSGDLEVARNMIVEIGKVSNATGADMGKLGEVAGGLDLKLQATITDAKKREEVISNIMRAFAAQGKMGAIDIEQLAPQIPKLIAAAGAYAGNKEDAFRNTGIVAQLSAKAGGSASPAMAAQAMVAFTRDMQKGKGVQAMLAGGMKESDIFADKGHKQLKNPVEMIMAAVLKSGGDSMKFSAMFKNSAMMRAGLGMKMAYNEAGGGKAGEAAMQKEYADLKKANMTKDEIDQENAAIMKTTAAKAQVFQNKLEAIASTMADRVLPAFEKLEPTVTKLAESFSGAIAWASENPWEAVSIAAAASIAKAGLDQVFKTGIDAAIKAAVGGGGGGAVGGAGGGGLAGGAMGGALVGGVVGILAMNSASKLMKGDTKGFGAEDALALSAAAPAAGMVALGGAGMAFGEGLGGRIGNSFRGDKGLMQGGAMGGLGSLLAGGADASGGGTAALEAKIDALNTKMANIDGTLKGGIKITSMPGGVPGVDSAGRKGP